MCFSDPPAAQPAPAPPAPTPLYVNKGPGDSETAGSADFGASRKKLRIELNPAGPQGTGIAAPGV